MATEFGRRHDVSTEYYEFDVTDVLWDLARIE